MVEHKDRATRFGFRYLEMLLEQQGRRIEVVNLAENGREDLVADLVAIVYSFCARLYGQRRAKRKTETMCEALTGQEAPVAQWREEGEASMRLVEQHRIDRHDPRFAAIDAAAFASKNLYNAALYATRQAFIHERPRHHL